MRTVPRFLVILCLAPALLAQTNNPTRRLPGTIAFDNVKVYSMDPNNTTYQRIQIVDGKVAPFTSNALSNAVQLPPKATIFPGFIDSHSHAFSLLSAQAVGPKGIPYWQNLGNVNVMLLPPCAPGKPTGSVTCFTPVTTQQEVVDILRKPAAVNEAGWVLGWNYEPSRMKCPHALTQKISVSGHGFDCPNFENQTALTALEQMEAIRSDVPMLVTTEAGHIAYVNKKALVALNICGTLENQVRPCQMPIQNKDSEIALAKTGQLNEDLAFYAIESVMGLAAENYSGGSTAKKLEFMSKQIRAALDVYSSLGYTTVQEGAANNKLINVYMATALKGELPVRMAFLAYFNKPITEFASTVEDAASMRDVLEAGFDMFIPGMKIYSDGSNQGYTGDMQPGQYQNLKKPFIDEKIFKQPYHGLPDFTRDDVRIAADQAHKKEFGLWVHTNGTEAQANVIGALSAGRSPHRDVIVHFSTPTREQVAAVQSSNIGATFLINNSYYYYQPLCTQILGPDNNVGDMYPAKWAVETKLPFGLHSDVSVTPPSPLFSMWVATERPQQNPWGALLPEKCVQQQFNQVIGRLDAMRAYTSHAAWLYGREKIDSSKPERVAFGSLQPGFAGDLVILSDDPLTAPDLSKIYVLYTIKNGNIVYPKTGTGPATRGTVWPK